MRGKSLLHTINVAAPFDIITVAAKKNSQVGQVTAKKILKCISGCKLL